MNQLVERVMEEAKNHYEITLAARHSKAWNRVIQVLNEVSPGWDSPNRPGSVEDLAVEAIRKLTHKSKEQERTKPMNWPADFPGKH